MNLEGLEGASKVPVENLRVSKVPTMFLRVFKMQMANLRVSKVPAMIMSLLLFLPQPRHNPNILWKRILLRHRQGCTLPTYFK